MSLKFTSGGPAFPAEMTVLLKELNTDVPETDVRTTTIKHGGMTLRDYFAAKAMQGLLASSVSGKMQEFAERSYKVADAMLEARK